MEQQRQAAGRTSGSGLHRGVFSRAIEELFWRLPYSLRRAVARTCGVSSGIPPSLATEVLQRKILFIQVPKTAGVSVQHSLFGHTLFRHKWFRQFELEFSKSQLASLFKFAFVRNPWDRIVSAWTFLREGGMNEQDKEWFSAHAAQFPDFESFVLNWLARQDVVRAYVHFQPQVVFVRSGRGRVELDFVGRFESLTADFERLSQLLGRPAVLQSRNRTPGREAGSYRDYYTPKSAEVVARLYRDDIRTFGYEF
jgi:hypothetical protein